LSKNPKALGYGISGGVFQTRYPEDIVENLIDRKNGQVIPGQYQIQIPKIADLDYDWSTISKDDQQVQTVGTHWPLSRALTKEMRTAMERTGLCMGCHREMSNALKTFILLFACALAAASAAPADDPGGTPAGTSAFGRPHGSAYDPHGALELRYAVRPLGRIVVDYEDPHSSAPDPNHMFPLMFHSMVTLLSNGRHSPTREYPREQTGGKFNADWASSRVRAGGAPVTVRLVKGANMEMERVDAALHGWPQAPFRSKLETDANFKRMLREGLRAENIAAVRLGLASHNLFDLAYGLVLGHERGVSDRVQLEMLEGMANHQRRALAEVVGNLLLYAPATRREQFVHAIGYLVRRLDENTGEDNFLSHAFRLRVDSDEWRRLANQFAASFRLLESLPQEPRRTQDRRQTVERPTADDLSLNRFVGEPDTDFSLPGNLDWARQIIDRWQPRCGDRAADIPLVVAGREIREDRDLRDCLDPSRPGTVVGRYREAGAQDLPEALVCARADPARWRVRSPQERAAILGGVAQVVRERRADLMGAALADREQAIRNLLHSAFSHSGQKCSATSLLILEAEVYDDPDFKRALCDAVARLPVGSAWDRSTRVGPLIRPPAGALERALKELEPDEEWAVMPRRLQHNPCLWSPGVNWDVQPGGFTHNTELFGPVLGVMRARGLEHAIELVNQTGYGLTSGIETLDEREHIPAGNPYLNRVTTGAVVLRQPFGGMGNSAFGPGIKVGGPNYVAQFVRFQDRAARRSRAGSVSGSGRDAAGDPLIAELIARPSAQRSGTPAPERIEAENTLAAIASYRRAMDEEFGREHDHFRLLGQDNVRRYRPVRDLRIRMHPEDGPFEVIARIAAARIAGCRITLSTPSPFALAGPSWLLQAIAAIEDDIGLVEEDDQSLAEVIRGGETDRARFAAPNRVPEEILKAAAESSVFIARAPVVGEGRGELL
jgi:hypothetical protein